MKKVGFLHIYDAVFFSVITFLKSQHFKKKTFQSFVLSDTNIHPPCSHIGITSMIYTWDLGALRLYKGRPQVGLVKTGFFS